MPKPTIKAGRQQDTEFVVCFGGEPADLSASTLLPCLLSIAAIVEEINREIGDPQPMELRIRATRPGSFEVDLLLGLAGAAASGLFGGDVSQRAKDIITLLGAILNIRKHLKKDPPAQTTETAGKVVIQNTQGSKITVDKRSFAIYVNNSTVNLQMDQAFQALDADPMVTRFEVTGSTDVPLFTVERDEFGQLTAGASLAETPERIEIQQVALTIVKVSFDPKLKWEFVYLGNRVGAYMRDESFSAAVDRREVAFAKGDVLDVDLELHQVWDSELGAFINREYRVLKVRGHKKQGNQEKIPFE
ncbi:MAG: hypothetical protein V1694_11875 [Candidatus Eisenbacteria bacterium]